MEYEYQAIVLNKKDIGEADRFYTFYTLEYGKIQAIAKGVRKSKARLAGQLENFSHVNLSVARSRGTGKVTGVIAENYFPSIRGSLEALLLSFELARIAEKLTEPESPDKKIFEIILSYFKAVDSLVDRFSESGLRIIALGAIFKLLDQSGYRIEVSACAKCGNFLSGSRFRFSPRDGGVLCGKCSADCPDTLPVTVNAIKLIRIFFSNRLSSLSKIKVGAKDMDILDSLSRSFLRWIGA